VARDGTHDDIGITESLGNIGDSPEITFMRLDIGIPIQTPHRPAPLGLDHL